MSTDATYEGNLSILGVADLTEPASILIGLCSGILGIGITLLISVPVNSIVYKAFEIERIASLPVLAAIILIAISMKLYLIC